MRRILVDNVRSFWLRGTCGPDGDHGLHCDQYGRWSARGRRRLVVHARALWFLARLIEHGDQAAEVTAAARRSFLLLAERFWDMRHGGFYWELNESAARPTMPDKHAYGQAQALYALSQYALATGCSRATDLARRTFELLEDRFHDTDQNGYLEQLRVDWTRTAPGRLDYLQTPSGLKTANTHLHLLEALTVYLRLSRDELAQRRLDELARIVGKLALHPVHATLVDRHERHWGPVVKGCPQVASYGHDLEIIHLLSAADRELGFPEGHRLDLYRRIFDHARRYGEDEALGGLWSSGPPGQTATDRRKIWWVQAEALLGMLELYRLTGEGEVIEAFLRTLSWVQQWQVDWSQGEWHAEVRGGRAYGPKAGSWKGPYHNGRALIEGIEILDQLIEQK